MSPNPLAAERRLQALRHALGETVLAAVVEPLVVEILCNPDGRIVLDLQGRGRVDTGDRLGPEARERVIKLVADHVGETVGRDQPLIAGVLPGGGERFQGVLPPVSAGPAFSIRKRPGSVWSLDDYVADGSLSVDMASDLRRAIVERRNVVVSGGTGSGKTTFANALLAEPGFAEDRLIIIEDTPELRSSAWDAVALVTRRRPVAIGVGELVRDALRLRPDRIVVGEIRDGAAALETLKSWNTGHPGGLSTLHANSAEDALRRLENLIAEVSPSPASRMIAAAVDRIVHIQRTRDGRRVEAVIGVLGFEEGQYRLSGRPRPVA